MEDVNIYKELIVRTYQLNKLMIVVIFSAGSLSLQAEEIKCWTNANGDTECGNIVPPEVTQGGLKEFNEKGQLTGEIGPGKTPEEIAKEKEKQKLESKRKEQEKEDRKLLALFTSEEEIQQQLNAIVSTIEGQVTAMETIVESLRKNLQDLESNFEKSQGNPEIPESQLDTIKRNIESVKQRLKDNEKSVAAKVTEKNKVTQEYADYLKRFKDIKRRGVGVIPTEEAKGGEKVSPPAPGKTPVPSPAPEKTPVPPPAPEKTPVPPPAP